MLTGYLGDVLTFDVERPVKHPTQKPVKLLENIIETYSNPGELVLDNVAGVSSTAVAAQNVGRNFIMIEKEKR